MKSFSAIVCYLLYGAEVLYQYIHLCTTTFCNPRTSQEKKNWKEWRESSVKEKFFKSTFSLFHIFLTRYISFAFISVKIIHIFLQPALVIKE